MAERPLAYWLALVDRLVEERFAGALEEHGVTRTQYRVLGVLAGGPATATDLESAMSDLPPDSDGISAADELAELVESGTKEGAEIYQPPCRLPEKGWWFAPTVFTNVAQSHRIAQEEIFGPVLSVLTFRTPDEAVEKANNTMYGLSAGVWTEKGSRILWMADRLRAGVVWGNTFNRFDPASPFGGYKESGFGREGGRHGLEAYLRFE